MKIKFLGVIVLMVFVLTFVITGCSNTQTLSTIAQKPSPVTQAQPTITQAPASVTVAPVTQTPSAPPVTPLTPPAVVSVDESFNGKEVIISAGGSLQVALNSNPTTGFKWDLIQNSDPTVLEKVNNIFETPQVKRPAGEPPLVGASGKEFWNFKAMKKGSSVLSMEYSRPWAGGEKGVQKFSLTVNVQ